MKTLVAAFIVTIAGAIGGYLYLFYPPTVLKRETARALETFGAAVATKDRAKVGQVLQQFLTDDAKIRLEISFVALTQPTGTPILQDFDKSSFITFIDNVLYPLSDYAYEAQLQRFKLSEDRKTASVSFASKEWADGVSYYGGLGIDMRFSSDTLCEGETVFAEKPRLAKAVCTTQLRMVPRPGQEEKLKQFLR